MIMLPKATAWRKVLLLLFTMAASLMNAQPFVIFNGTDNTCAGAFLDSGGQGALGYLNNEDYTYTLCPGTPGSSISVSFVTFTLSLAGAAPIDNMMIYDGATIGAPLIGTYTGTSLQGQTITAGPGNASGCLTFVWHSNNNGTGVFAATIACEEPCLPPVAAATMSIAAPAQICMGDNITFNGSTSTAQPGRTIVSYAWDFDDGNFSSSAAPTATHAYSAPGVYMIELTVTDNTGCESVNLINLEVLVAPPPTFTGTAAGAGGCVGETVCLNGQVNPTTFTETPGDSFGDGIFIPDEVGSCFVATMYLDQFTPGATLTNISQLLSICIDIEHSWLGDLVMTLTSPSGQSVILHQQGITTETLLGNPVDNDEANPTPGTCDTYCFSNTSANGTMAAFANANGGLGYTLPPGTYQSVQSFNGLIGSQLNGTWTLTICDMWALDNGFLCGWDLNLDPSLYTNLDSFTPDYGAGCDSTWWTGPGIISSSSDCEQICIQQAVAGQYDYVYHVVDDFGCAYDTTVTITIAPPIVVDAGPAVSLCSGASAQLLASVLSGGMEPPECTYTLELFDSFGDGWDGASVTVTVNGVATAWTLNNGSAGSTGISVTDGDVIQLTYNASALFNAEHSYDILDGNGSILYAAGPGPVNGLTWNGIVDCGPNVSPFVYSWSPATGLSNPNIANPTATPGSTTTYTVTVSQPGFPGCTGRDQVTVTIVTPNGAGTDGAVTVCSSDASFDLFGYLGAAASGGSWTAPGGGATSSTFTPGTSSAGVYIYSVASAAPCPGLDQSTVTVTVVNPPNPGTNGAVSVCSNGAAVSLFAQLGGAPQAGGTWSGPSPVVGGMFSPGTMSAGNYTYGLPAVAPCPAMSSTVAVTVNQPPDAGTSGAVTMCSTGAAIDLIAQLGGTPDLGGTWSGPSAVVGGMIDPATMNAGVYTYTIAGTAPCPDQTATVTVTINTPPDPGTNGSITLCTSSAAASLFAQLGGTPDAGGTWSGPSAVVGGMIDPATMSAGVYTYTVAGTAPCPDQTASVTVTINTPPDPGTNGSITLCTSSAAASLFAQLGGTPDAGGTWSGPSAVVGGMIDPATMSAGLYTYTVAGTAPCPDQTATVTVTINTPPDPGTNGSITLCTSSAAASFFAQLGGTPDAGGAWSGPSAVVGGMIDPATMSAGVYTYTVAGTSPCPNETATVTVTINTPPDPGTNGTIMLCTSSAAASLFAQLGGTPDAGGTWSGPSAVVGGMIDPATMSAGVYTYTVAGTAPCPNETATVTVTINTPPDPGTNGSITLCNTSAAASLFAELGGTPDAGGTWSGPSAVVGGMIDPATMSAGVYTYTVVGTAPCPNETATVTVTINTPPDPGTNGSITLCTSSAAASLFAQLGGTPDAGGTWSGPSTVVGGMIDPATMSAGVYTYTVSGTAPCPNETATVTVTINTPPDPGTNGSITLCTSSAAASLFAQLGGTPDAGGTWSGPSAVVGGMIDPATMSAGVYTYTVSGTAPCPNETATVTVTINSPPDPGTNGSITLCSTSAAASLFAQLGGTPDAGGTWSGPSAVVGGMIDPATMNAGVYTYTVAGTVPCPDQTATVTVTINTPPDPGTNGSITLCNTSAAASLFAQLGGTPDAGGTWSGPSAVVGGMIDPTTMSGGIYTYTVSGTSPCPNASATVSVIIEQQPDAGIDGGLTLCSSSPATALFGGLSGTPDAGGVWTGPGGIASNGMFTAGTNTVGTYTYTVSGAPPCPNASATVNVVVVTNPNAGTPGAITLCTSDGPALLFDALGGTPDGGGTWTGPSAVVGGQFDPASMNIGVYTYTISVPPPCTNASSTVTVSLNTPPDAGSDGALTLCATSPATSLTTGLGGSPDAGGTWTGPSAVVGGLFNPATMTAGVYTYTVNGTAPCPPASANVTVTVVTNPDAGTPGTITLCTSDASTDLFTQLGGTPDLGGTWSGPSAVVGGQFDPALMNAGVYTYTISVPPPCTNASSTVTVSLNSPPDAGSDGALTLCATSTATSLSTGLGGTPDAGGTWTGPSAVVGGLFNPATMTAGVYTYTVNGTAPCPPASATVTVNVVSNPDAGTPGAITLCTTDAAADLFTQLGGTPDLGGSWTGPSTVVGGQFDPATMTAGVYTYTITVPPPCTNASSTVTVSLNTPPDAGSDGALTLCATSPATSLSTGLGGTPDAGGTWTGPSAVVGGLFNPATMTAGVYTYTVNGTAPCPPASASVTVSVVTNPDAGTPGAITLCSTDAAADLFTQLGGTPDVGGTWSGPSALNGSSFDPATMSAGMYTYTITVPPPCSNASSTVTVALNVPPDPGLDGTLTLCATSPAVALLTGLGGSPDAGGSWSGPSAVAGGMFDPSAMTAGVYTYTVNGTAPCPPASATVNVNVVANPDAGTPGTITLCTTDASADLFAQLGGTPDAGGSWSGPSVVVGSSFDPGTMSAGLYTYTITVPPPCSNASSTVSVTLNTPPDPGVDGALTLCISSPNADLFTSLGGTPEPGGTWTAPGGSAFSGSFDPATDAPGIYTYTVTGTAPCPPASATVTVNVITLPDPGSPGALTLCITDPAASLFAQLGGTPDVGGSWTDPGGLAFSGTFDPAVDQAGIYTYTISVPPPCVSVTSTVTMTLNLPPDAGLNGTLTLCASSGASALFNSLGGTPDTGGSWTDPNGNAHNGTFDPSVDQAGIYTYTVNGLLPCPNASASATVSVTPQVNPGQPSILNLCISGAPVDLFPALGPADANGTWTGPLGSSFGGTFTPGTDPAGAYTYTVAGTPPCPSGSAVITVNVLSNPDAGIDGALTLCSNNPSLDLFTALGGTPDPGGVWLDPLGQLMTTLFDPDSSASGLYTYMVLVPQPCVNDTAQVNVAVVVAPEAGVDGALTLCVNDPAVPLFGLLSGSPDPGGSWTSPNNQPYNGPFDPAVDAPGNYTYTVTGTSPCPNDAAVVTMTVDPMPDAGTDGSTTVCPEAAPVTLFTLLGGTPDVGGQWTDPNGVACTGVFDPATCAQGAYTYTVISQGACPNVSASATINIFVIAVPDAGPDMVVCDKSVALNATGVWSSGQWSAPSTVVVFNVDTAATLATSSIGGAATFVWSTISSDGCASADSVTVVFTEPIGPAVVAEDAVCFGYCDGTAEVTATGGNGTYGYQWSPAVAGNTSLATGLCAGTYAVTVLDTNGCSTQATYLIDQPPPLVIDNIVSTPETCPGTCDGTVTVVDPEGVLFSFDGGTTFQQGTTLTDLCAGPLNVVMMDINGCMAMSPAEVISPAPVIAEFVAQPDTVLVSDPFIQFTNQSENASWFTWNFAGLGGSELHDPGFSFPDVLGDTYMVCLTAVNGNGCVDSVCHPVVVLDLLAVHVPNSFTPNGDGINEGFMPIFNEPSILTDYELLIFDRWGELLFESHTPHEPWLGIYQGQMVKEEVYVWKLNYKDGRSYKKESVIGHVTVLK